MDDDFIEPISDEELSLSTLSLSGEISYDDISVGSFESDIEIDNLIKRTKQREQQFGNSYHQFFQTGTKNWTDEDCISLKSLEGISSIHSLSTLVLEPLNGAYSPTQEVEKFEMSDCEDVSDFEH